MDTPSRRRRPVHRMELYTFCVHGPAIWWKSLRDKLLLQPVSEVHFQAASANDEQDCADSLCDIGAGTQV